MLYMLAALFQKLSLCLLPNGRCFCSSLSLSLSHLSKTGIYFLLVCLIWRRLNWAAWQVVYIYPKFLYVFRPVSPTTLRTLSGFWVLMVLVFSEECSCEGS
ncbi:unnamed protein product [Prunus brigantina]